MALSSYGTLHWWLDMTQETSFADGAGVSSATDRSGAGRSFIGEGAAHPLMSTTAMNGRRAAYFDTTSNRRFQTNGSAPGRVPATTTILAVVKFMAATPPTQSRFLWDGDDDNQLSRHFCQWMLDGSLMIGTDGGGGNLSVPAGRIVPGKATVFSATYNGASSEARLDLVNIATGSITTSSQSAGWFNIGAHRSGSPSAGLLYLAEMACYSAPISQANLVAATLELMGKYNISTPGLVLG